MTGDANPLSREDIRADAVEILSALDASRSDIAAYEENWRRLWQLMREVKTAELAFQEADGKGPWHYQKDGVGGPVKGSAALAAGGFALPVWPPEEPRSPTDLPELLNWAGVPRLMSDGRSADRSGDQAERGSDGAERRREEAELHRRRNEEGRQIAEDLRSKGERLRLYEEDVRLTSESLRDSQEAARELAETARELAEALRRTVEDASSSAAEMRTSLADIKDVARKQRLVLERQEQALAAFNNRIQNLPGEAGKLGSGEAGE